MSLTYENKEMVKAAYYYYKKNLTQSEIAKKMFMSRQKVNRLLKKAQEENIVQITIVDFNKYNFELETKLEEKFNLTQSVVISNIDDKTITSSLGLAGAEYLEKILSTGDVVGVTSGSTLSEVAKKLKLNHSLNVSAVQLVGGMDIASVCLTPDEITRTIAQKLGGESYILYAPAIVENKSTKEAMISDESFKATFKHMEKCNIIIAGIGELKEDTIIYKENYFNKQYMEYLSGLGCVGDIGIRWYDKDGKAVEHEYDDRTIGYNILKNNTDALVIGIAGGKNKHEAVLGALKGGYLDVLITDNETAEVLIES
jgi:deoxyribonucleoside regulator